MTFRSLICVLALSACTAPDVTPQITSAKALLDSTVKPLKPALEQTAKAERRAAENLLIADGDEVYELVDCNKADAFSIMAQCRLVTKADPTRQPQSASATLEAFVALDAYFTAILGIASSQSSDGVKQAADQIVAALGDASQSDFAPIAKLGATTSKDAPAAAAFAGFIASQYRIAQLRRIVLKADPVVEDMLLTIAARLDLQTDLADRQTALVNAEADMQIARDARDPARYRQALDALATAYTAFDEGQKTAPGNSIRLLRAAHAQLLDRLNGGATTEELLATLTEIDALVTALKA